jgi:hypothetical protein
MHGAYILHTTICEACSEAETKILKLPPMLGGLLDSQNGTRVVSPLPSFFLLQKNTIGVYISSQKREIAKMACQIKRAVGLSEKTHSDLKRLAEHLGINVHSYMVTEIAKSVQRDLLLFELPDSDGQKTKAIKK